MTALKAMLAPLHVQDRYLIEVAGIVIKSRHAENRMAKALALAGITGKMEVYGPSADGSGTILRITVDIEKPARHRWSEDDSGIRRRPWDELSLVPLADAVAKLSVTFKEGQARSAPARTSGQCPNRVLERHGGRELKP